MKTRTADQLPRAPISCFGQAPQKRLGRRCHWLWTSRPRNLRGYPTIRGTFVGATPTYNKTPTALPYDGRWGPWFQSAKGTPSYRG